MTMARHESFEEHALGSDRNAFRFLPQRQAGNLPEWREATFPTREDILIGALALGIVLAVLFIAATVLTA